MYKIRQIKYSVNSVSIQVYKIENRRRVIVRHIGTAGNDDEKIALLSLANDFIEKASKQLYLFDTNHSNTLPSYLYNLRINWLGDSFFEFCIS